MRKAMCITLHDICRYRRGLRSTDVPAHLKTVSRLSAHAVGRQSASLAAPPIAVPHCRYRNECSSAAAFVVRPPGTWKLERTVEALMTAALCG